MKSYDSIVAPLKKIESSLKAYATTQWAKRMKLVKEQASLDTKIKKCDNEIYKSDATSSKIDKLLDTTKKK